VRANGRAARRTSGIPLITYLRPTLIANRRHACAGNYDYGQNQWGVSATYYHASLLEQERNRRHKLWMKGRVHVMVATVAFGIGAPPSPALPLATDNPRLKPNYSQSGGLAQGLTSPTCASSFTRPSPSRSRSTTRLVHQRTRCPRLPEFCVPYIPWRVTARTGVGPRGERRAAFTLLALLHVRPSALLATCDRLVALLAVPGSLTHLYAQVHRQAEGAGAGVGERGRRRPANKRGEAPPAGGLLRKHVRLPPSTAS
jgi:hypothetical protein